MVASHLLPPISKIQIQYVFAPIHMYLYLFAQL